MKSIFLVFFLVVIAFSANAQKKPSKKEIIQLIESIISGHTIDYPGLGKCTEMYSIKGRDMDITTSGSINTITHLKDIHWENLWLNENTPQIKTISGFTLVVFNISPWVKGTVEYKESPDLNGAIFDRPELAFYVPTDKVETLTKAFLRLKEIYK